MISIVYSLFWCDITYGVYMVRFHMLYDSRTICIEENEEYWEINEKSFEKDAK